MSFWKMIFIENKLSEVLMSWVWRS